MLAFFLVETKKAFKRISLSKKRYSRKRLTQKEMMFYALPNWKIFSEFTQLIRWTIFTAAAQKYKSTERME
jgi:hypothetical protein